jgi:murein DD-endopeptidase MepM/ murein hydrolase activator NlpD
VHVHLQQVQKLISFFGLMKFLFPVLFSLLLFPFAAASQDSLHVNPFGFINPMKVPMLINGTFGELRGSHFHSGIDIKTEEREGLEVFAVADGYVSRVRVSAWGFGKALYITHPNGYTTVYAHLRNFNDAIEKYIKAQQYKRQSFEIDINLNEDLIKVKQGELIAYSGNTGSSAGPHLHFEVRDSKTEKPMDPYLFGFKPEDDLPPLLKSITIYALDTLSYNGSAQAKHRITLRKSGDKYVPAFKEPLELSGKIGLGIELIDHMPGLANKLGVASITLSLNNKIIYHFDITSFHFYETRFINSHLDYEERARSGRIVQKSFIDPGNKLSAYVEKGNGIIYPKPGEHLTFKYTVIDNAGNVSVCEFEAKGVYTAKRSVKAVTVECVAQQLFSYAKINKFSNADVSVEIPLAVLYDDLHFCYDVSPNPGKYYSPVHFIHNKYTPAHTSYSLSIKAEELPAHLEKKAFIAYLENGSLAYEGGIFGKGIITANVRRFGAFVIAADTTPPVIRPVNIKCGTTVRGNELRIHISDDLAGITSYRAEIDGRWELFEFDGKSGILSHQFATPAEGRQHQLKLRVVDAVKNESILECGFRR